MNSDLDHELIDTFFMTGDQLKAYKKKMSSSKMKKAIKKVIIGLASGLAYGGLLPFIFEATPFNMHVPLALPLIASGIVYMSGFLKIILNKIKPEENNTISEEVSNINEEEVKQK